MAAIVTVVLVVVHDTGAGRTSAGHTAARSSSAAAHGRHGDGGSGAPGAAGSSPAASPSTTTPSTAPPTTAPPTTTTGPGTLPQTDAFPSSSSSHFQVEMADLWRGIVSDSVTPAMPSFFPEGAYLRLKAIADASADWEHRLVGDFSLDIGAAHDLLGSDPSAATLVSVNVPSQYGHWVAPGACYNSIGYFEVPNARIVYRVGGSIRSFGIASMISWRGEWYVVHLGAVLRTTTKGVVDDPATGPGSSAYSSTC